MKCPTNRHIDHRQQKKKKERKRVGVKCWVQTSRTAATSRNRTSQGVQFKLNFSVTRRRGDLPDRYAWSAGAGVVSVLHHLFLACSFILFPSTVLACGDWIRPRFRLLVIFICGCVEPVRPFACSHLYFAFSNSFMPVDLTAALMCQTCNLHYCTLHVLFSRYWTMQRNRLVSLLADTWMSCEFRTMNCAFLSLNSYLLNPIPFGLICF